MRFARRMAHRFRSLFRRSRVEADLEREIDLHIEQLIRERMAAGMAETEARADARREFGIVALTKEQCRDTRRTGWIEALARDLSFAVRVLGKSPVFTLTAVASLALGIGANTAIYSFMDAIMIRALPIPHPEDLVVLNLRAAKGWPGVAHSQHGDDYKEANGASVFGTFPYAAWELLRDRNDSFSTLFAFASAGRLNLVAGKEALLGDGEYVSGDYFSGIGAPPAAGRLIGEDDDRAGGPAVAVISYPFWEQHFNGSPRAIGQTILIDRNIFTIVGVTAPGFYGVNPGAATDVFVPLHALAWLDLRVGGRDWFHDRNNYWVEMMGRLRPGISSRQAEVRLAGLFHQFVVSTAANDKERANLPALWLEPGGSGIDSLRRQYSKPLFVLMTMTGLILAIACANLANLLLARAEARRREIAVRLSLGAGRWRIVRQLLTESVLMALAGGAAGLGVAALGIRFLTWLLANGQPDFTLRAGIDVRILLFAIAISVATGILFGLAPAIQATKVDVTPALRESRGMTQRVRPFGLPFGVSPVLISGQIALSLLLVIAAGLFVRTLGNLHSVSMGFDAENLLIFRLNARQAGHDDTRDAGFYESLRRRFANIPGVRAATMSDMAFVAGNRSATGFTVPGVPAATDRPVSTNTALIGPSFFETMRIPILSGRALGEQDTANGPRVVVVNEVFAKQFLPAGSSIGRHFTFDGRKPMDVEVVGVARNSLYSSLKGDVPPVAYLAWSQAPGIELIRGMYFEIRAAGNPLALANTVRQIVHQADPAMPVADLTTQVQKIESTIAPERAFADLCSCFGVLALLIASIGLYGTTAYAVARRTNEIGLRVALGAQRRQVIRMVLREVLGLAVIGLAAGLGIAWEAARFVATFLYGVRPKDPVTFGLSAAILIACALAAGYVPAWRASRIDPMQALRHE